MRKPLIMAVFLGLVSACGPSLRGSSDPARVARLHRVVVLPFSIPEGAPRSLSDGFADEITSDLAGAGFAVVDREAVDETGADAVLLGRVVTYRDQAASPEVETSLAVSVQLVDVRTREVLLSTSSDATAAGVFCSQEMTCLRGKVLAAMGRFIAASASR